jgi:hypothetical protein
MDTVNIVFLGAVAFDRPVKFGVGNIHNVAVVVTAIFIFFISAA